MTGSGQRTGGSPAAVGAVLAGGRGSRLGGGKAVAPLGDRPLIAHPLAAVEAAGLEPVVVAKPGSELPPLACHTIAEPELPRHPLCGIVAALRDAGGRPLVALACDMPFATPDLLARLAAAPEPLVAVASHGELQPLLARYDGSLLPALEAALGRAEPLRRTVESLGPRLIEGAELARFGDPERLLFNVNTAADLRRAEELLAAPAR